MRIINESLISSHLLRLHDREPGNLEVELEAVPQDDPRGRQEPEEVQNIQTVGPPLLVEQFPQAGVQRETQQDLLLFGCKVRSTLYNTSY